MFFPFGSLSKQPHFGRLYWAFCRKGVYCKAEVQFQLIGPLGCRDPDPPTASQCVGLSTSKRTPAFLSGVLVLELFCSFCYWSGRFTIRVVLGI